MSTSSHPDSSSSSFSLTEDEQSEMSLAEFVRHFIFHEGKFGREDSYFMSPLVPKSSSEWGNLLQIMSDFEKVNSIELEIDELGGFLDLTSYIQIVQDYIRLYGPESERKRFVAIVSLLVFARLYARRLRQRVSDNESGEQFTQRDLERLTTYTIHVIQELLRNEPRTGWDQFCRELGAYQTRLQSRRSGVFGDPRSLLITASVFGCLAGICWFIYRSSTNISVKPQ